MAESLLNPFGDDDENFCVDFLIDRNLQVGILKVFYFDKNSDRKSR